jgi:MerR family transcriptional regulator, thiopeptide resistance regulator
MYTVQKLAQIAGVTPRTLRHYDAIGLLKPDTIGENGYRYYNEHSVILLQQILLYREMEIPLDDIKQILVQPDFDVISSLEKHRAELTQRITRLHRLIKTIEKTIAHQRGDLEMENKQFFEGFSEAQQEEYEKEAMQKYDPAVVKASNQKWKNYTKEEKQKIFDEGNLVYQAFADAMSYGSESEQAQSAVGKWRAHMGYFWTPNDEQLLGLADLYNQDERFKANYERYEIGLAEFVREAVKIYVDRRKNQ